MVTVTLSIANPWLPGTCTVRVRSWTMPNLEATVAAEPGNPRRDQNQGKGTKQPGRVRTVASIGRRPSGRGLHTAVFLSLGPGIFRAAASRRTQMQTRDARPRKPEQGRSQPRLAQRLDCWLLSAEVLLQGHRPSPFCRLQVLWGHSRRVPFPQLCGHLSAHTAGPWASSYGLCTGSPVFTCTCMPSPHMALLLPS
ncbi:hypothetical protein VTK56DRAFT_8231 [Thermocarpiscus australiensis]